MEIVKENILYQKKNIIRFTESFEIEEFSVLTWVFECLNHLIFLSI